MSTTRPALWDARVGMDGEGIVLKERLLLYRAGVRCAGLAQAVERLGRGCDARRHAEGDAAMVMAEQPLEVPAGAARALLVGVEKDVW